MRMISPWLLMSLLAHLSTALHLFVAHSDSLIGIKQPFTLVMDGDDCPYDPCYFTVTLSGDKIADGTYENVLKTLDVTVSDPGPTDVVVVFSDRTMDSQIPYSGTLLF